MGIVGSNGTGKSTFVKMLLGLVPPDSGQFVVGETVRFGYFSQQGLQFRDDQKVIDVVRDIADYIDMGGGKHISASQLLQHFLFTNEQQHNFVRKLSGGEKRKLYLCTVLMQNPNFLVLDEPTNDLDIQTLQILEEYLQDFPGCVIVVSHDRYFTDKVVDHLLVFKGNGQVNDFPGNYTQYRLWQKANTDNGKQESGKKDSNPTVKKKAERQKPQPEKRRMTYKERLEFEKLDKEIADMEAEKKRMEEALCSGTLSVEEITDLSRRLPALNDELEEKSMRWLELSEING
jgi:ATP-binding cassette subfamily F protein uup